jgi:hypothetical protein
MGDSQQAAKLAKNVQHGGGGFEVLLFFKAVFWLVSQIFGYFLLLSVHYYWQCWLLIFNTRFAVAVVVWLQLCSSHHKSIFLTSQLLT